MASLSFKEKMALFNKKKSPSQEEIVRKGSTASPKLARKLSQLGKKLPMSNGSGNSNSNDNDSKNRTIPKPQRLVPKRLIPNPVRIKPPTAKKEGRSRTQPVLARTQSMPGVIKMGNDNSPGGSGSSKIDNGSNSNNESVNTKVDGEGGENKTIESSTPTQSASIKQEPRRRIRSNGGGAIAALQNKLKLASPNGAFSPTPLSPFGSRSGGLRSTHSMSRMKANTESEINHINDQTLLMKSDSFRHTASDKHKNVGEITHDTRAVIKQKRRPRTKMKKINF